MPNYSYVINNSFRPFSMQEMLVPFNAYKEAYEQADETYTDLTSKADKFKYLSENLPEGSKARQLYEGYANELNAQAADLATNGLSMNNRRALSNLRRRYSGEIGRLDEAQTRLDKEIDLRRQMSIKDPTMLYALDNLDIDMYLDNNTPNLYGISGNDLYTRGQNAGKAASSRIYNFGDLGSTLGGYYRMWGERNGYSADSINAFRANASAIPELQQAADDILRETGAYSNLTGNNLERARQGVINGIIDGAVYKEDINPTRDLGVMSRAEQDASARAWVNTNIAKEKWDEEKKDLDIERQLRYNYDEDGNVIGYNPSYTNMDNYELTPDGKWRRKTSSKSPIEKAEASSAKAKGTELMKLKKADLAHNEGFDVTFGDNRHHYDYIGALTNSRGKWRYGAIGDDVPGHGWGFQSSSNVESKWGNFSAEGSDSPDMRVLSSDDVTRLLSQNPELLEAFNAQVSSYLEKMGVDPNSDAALNLDIQLIEVPNEKDSKKKGYLIAVH